MPVPGTASRRERVLRSLTTVCLLSSFVWFYWLQGNPIGFSPQTKNGLTHDVARSSPVVVALSVMGILLFIFLMTRTVRIETLQASSHRRRFLAFFLDCWFLMLTVIGASSLFHVLLDAQRSGTFRWSYERISGDASAADTVVILINLAVMFLYFVIPFAASPNGRTVGVRTCDHKRWGKCYLSSSSDRLVANIHGVQRFDFAMEAVKGN
jgi:hypothetical protein